jgi:hypothetical protein
MGALRARAAPLRAAVSRRAAALVRSSLLPLALLALLSPAAAFRASLRWAPGGSGWSAGVPSRRAAGPPAPARCAASGGRSRVRLALRMAGDSREVRHASVLWGARRSRLRAAWHRAALQVPRERGRRRLLIRAGWESSRRERRRGRRRRRRMRRAPARSSPRPSKTSSPAPSPSPPLPARRPRRPRAQPRARSPAPPAAAEPPPPPRAAQGRGAGRGLAAGALQKQAQRRPGAAPPAPAAPRPPDGCQGGAARELIQPILHG